MNSLLRTDIRRFDSFPCPLTELNLEAGSDFGSSSEFVQRRFPKNNYYYAIIDYY